MSSLYPFQPGYLYNHDPTKVDFPRVSCEYLTKKSFGEIKPRKIYKLPYQITPEEPKMRIGTSVSQSIFKNPYGEEIKEQYQPDFLKLDKQVLRFYGYFKESVVENELESARIRLLVICYYLADDCISITDVKQENSGIPQGPFLKKMRVKKEDDSYFDYKDFIVGKNIVIYGKIIHLYDCDKYTREFFKVNGITQFLKKCKENRISFLLTHSNMLNDEKRFVFEENGLDKPFVLVDVDYIWDVMVNSIFFEDGSLKLCVDMYDVDSCEPYNYTIDYTDPIGYTIINVYDELSRIVDSLRIKM